KGKFLYSNPAFERITGYKNADIIDSTPSLLKSGLYDNHFYKNMYQILNSGEVFSAKMVDKDASGNLFHLEQTIAPVSHKSGKITHYISVFKDISEEVAMKEELFLSQQRWKLALDGAGIGVWDWNAATNEVFFSKKWKSMIGFKDDEIGKTLEEWSNRVHPEDIDKC
ncbi:MAG: PAS domain S-box protein, partial [Flavobacteriales bacterium]|nr:PAS domain S-box protein [Flavobacteriales bacterium]